MWSNDKGAIQKKLTEQCFYDMIALAENSNKHCIMLEGKTARELSLNDSASIQLSSAKAMHTFSQLF